VSRFHPHATTLTLLLMAQEKYHSDLEHAVHDVIEKAMDLARFPEEQKADLYARIAEDVAPGMRMLDMQRAINNALLENARAFYAG
jgi:hypothetical protein